MKQYYSIVDCIENPGKYNIKIGNRITGHIESENGIIIDDEGNKYTDEDIWMITSWEEENTAIYEYID